MKSIIQVKEQDTGKDRERKINDLSRLFDNRIRKNEKEISDLSSGLSELQGYDLDKIIADLNSLHNHVTTLASPGLWSANFPANYIYPTDPAHMVLAPNFSSTIAVGTQPYACTSTTLNTNLNADMLDGYHAFMNDTLEPTGFVDRAAVLSWNDGLRTLTIAGDHDIWIHAVKYSKTTTAIQIADTTGPHFIYYDASATLVESTVWPGFYLPIIAIVYWNTTINKGLAQEERHGIVMDGASHEYLHDNFRTRYESGLAGTFTNTTFSIGAGSYADEDIEHTILAQTQCRVVYKNGAADFEWDDPTTLYYKEDGLGDILYNNGNVMAAVPNNRYVAYWFFATSTIDYPIICLMGQRTDTTLAAARANNTYESLSFGNIVFQELKILYRVILRNDATPYQETLDLRSLTPMPASNYIATAHSVLTGLEWGVAGHNDINFNVNRNADARCGFGTLDPSTAMHVYRNDALTTPQLLIEQDDAGDASLRLLLTGGQSYTLGIDNSETGDVFKISPLTALNNSDYFTMNSTGQIGIGCIPETGLHYSASGFSPFYIDRISANAFAQGFAFRKSRGGTGVLSGDQLFRFMAFGELNTGAYAAVSNDQNVFMSLATENFTTTNQGRRSVFYTVTNGGTATKETFVLENDGDVTIAYGDFNITSDSYGLKLGTGQDAIALYDGTNTVFRTLVGSANYVFDGYTTVDTDCTVKIIGGEAKDAILDFVCDEQDDAADTFRMRTVYNASSANNTWKLQCDNVVKGTMVDLVTVTTAGHVGINCTPNISGGAKRALSVSGGIGASSTAYLELQGRRTSGSGDVGSILGYNQTVNIGQILFFRDGADDAGGILLYTKATGLAIAESARFVSTGLRFPVDGEIIGFGADNSVTLTHIHNVGLQLNDAMALRFRESSTYIHSNDSGFLDYKAGNGLGGGHRFTVNSVLGGTFWIDKFVINGAQDDYNFIWSADANENGLMCDASARSGLGAVGVGCAPTTARDVVLSIATPTNQLDIFDFKPGAPIDVPAQMIVVYNGATPYYIPCYSDYE